MWVVMLKSPFPQSPGELTSYPTMCAFVMSDPSRRPLHWTYTWDEVATDGHMQHGQLATAVRWKWSSAVAPSRGSS